MDLVKPAQWGRKGPSCDHSRQHGTDDRAGGRHSRFLGWDTSSMDWGTCPVMYRKKRQWLTLLWASLGGVPVTVKFSQHSVTRHPYVRSLRLIDIS